jgi:hypothetical protein
MLIQQSLGVVAHILPVHNRAGVLPSTYPSRVFQKLRLVNRTDCESSAIITAAIALFESAGRDSGIAFLCISGVHIRTIARVLFRPGERRD